MKKINLLLTVPALVVPSTLVLSQCAKYKQFNGIVAELQKEFYVGDTISIDNVIIYKSFSGTKRDKIDWSEDIKVYHDDMELINFKTSGMLLPDAGDVNMSFEYGEFKTSIVVNVKEK